MWYALCGMLSERCLQIQKSHSAILRCSALPSAYFTDMMKTPFEGNVISQVDEVATSAPARLTALSDATGRVASTVAVVPLMMKRAAWREASSASASIPVLTPRVSSGQVHDERSVASGMLSLLSPPVSRSRFITLMRMARSGPGATASPSSLHGMAISMI